MNAPSLRREIKYTLHGADVGKLRLLLEGSCRRLVFNKPVSLVHSVYFDDWRLSALQANLDGVSPRRKVRIRWYDDPAPGSRFFLEIKWRRNGLTGKERHEVALKPGVRDQPFVDMVSAVGADLPERFRETILSHPEPVVLIRYKREYFVTSDNGQRITLDYDPVCFEQRGGNRISRSFGLPLHDFIVVEGKASPSAENLVPRLLHPLRLRAARCSKYVHACTRLGLYGTAP